jgi:DNA-binding transcriptional regulator YiaG
MTTPKTQTELDAVSETPMSREEFEAAYRAPRVKILRLALGWTQDEFAALTGVTPETLRDWESTRIAPGTPEAPPKDDPFWTRAWAVMRKDRPS